MKLGVTTVLFSFLVFFTAYAGNPASDLGAGYDEADVLYEYVNHWNGDEKAAFAVANSLGSFGLLLLGFGIGRISRGR